MGKRDARKQVITMQSGRCCNGGARKQQNHMPIIPREAAPTSRDDRSEAGKVRREIDPES